MLRSAARAGDSSKAGLQSLSLGCIPKCSLLPLGPLGMLQGEGTLSLFALFPRGTGTHPPSPNPDRVGEGILLQVLANSFPGAMDSALLSHCDLARSKMSAALREQFTLARPAPAP